MFFAFEFQATYLGAVLIYDSQSRQFFVDYQDGEGLRNELSLCLDGNHYYLRGQGSWVWNTMALINTIFHSFQLQLRSTRREQTTNILISTILKTLIEMEKT